jgi:opacity protein-like surface antigen
MKKTLITTSLIALFATSPALAKTSGNYFGIDLNRSMVDYKSSFEDGGEAINTKADNSNIGFGLNYKYAFNFDKFFVAPGIFFDQINNKIKDEDGSLSLNHRYGVKFDIGYDLTDDFAIYFTNGLASTSYKMQTFGEGKSGSKASYFFGGGVSYSVAKNLTLNLEYNVQSFNLKTTETDVKTNLGMAKIGLSYHF